MQTAIANFEIAVDTAIARPAAQANAKTQLEMGRILKTLARKWDMIGVLAIMGSSVLYAAAQLMTLGR